MPFVVAANGLPPLFAGARDTRESALAYAKALFSQQHWQGTELSFDIYDRLPYYDPADPHPRRKKWGNWVDGVTVESWIGTGTEAAPAMTSVTEWRAAQMALVAPQDGDTEGPLQVDGQYRLTSCGPTLNVLEDTDDNENTPDPLATDAQADDVDTGALLDWCYRAVPVGVDPALVGFSDPTGPSYTFSDLYPAVAFDLEAQDADEETTLLSADSSYTAPAFKPALVVYGDAFPTPNNVVGFAGTSQHYNAALFGAGDFYGHTGDGTGYSILVHATVDNTEPGADPCTWGQLRDTYTVSEASAYGMDVSAGGYPGPYDNLPDSVVTSVAMPAWEGDYVNRVRLDIAPLPVNFVLLFVRFTVAVRRTFRRDGDGATFDGPTSPAVQAVTIIVWGGNPTVATGATATASNWRMIAVYVNRSGKVPSPTAVDSFFHPPHRIGGLYSGGTSLGVYDGGWLTFPWTFPPLLAPVAGKVIVGFETIDTTTLNNAPVNGDGLVVAYSSGPVYADGPEVYYVFVGAWQDAPPGNIGVLVPVLAGDGNPDPAVLSPNPPADTVYPFYTSLPAGA